MDVTQRGDSSDRWDELGVSAELASVWRDLGFSAFEAALAQGDGLTPELAVGAGHQVQSEAEKWTNAGLDSNEGLRWHRAGIPAARAAESIAEGVDIDEASRRFGHSGEG